MTGGAWEEALARYDDLVSRVPGLARRGVTMPYTAVNGHMFSQLNKQGEIGVRLPSAAAQRLQARYATGPFRAYGALMKGYLRLPEALLRRPAIAARYLRESYAYAQTLPRPARGAAR